MLKKLQKKIKLPIADINEHMIKMKNKPPPKTKKKDLIINICI